jgi:sulfate transport system permease protein
VSELVPSGGPILGRPRPAGGAWGRRLIVGVVLAYLGVLVVWPLVAIVQGALAEGLGAFLRVFADPVVLGTFGLTVRIAAVAVAVNGVFGVVVALVLQRHRFPGRALLNGMLDLPLVVSPVIVGYMVLLLFGRGGWLTPLAALLHVRVAFAVPGMILATVFVTAPFVAREVGPVLRELGTEGEEAASTLGAGGWTVFRRITLPGIRWGLAYGLALTLARALGEFGAVLVAGGAVQGRTETATLFIYRSLDERQPTAAYAVSILLGAVSFAILLGMEALRRRNERGR